jgi:hypothetical protein
MVQLLNGQANRTTALHWFAGHYHAPAWALHILADAIERRAFADLEIVRKTRATKERPGKKAGALNLAKWRARKIEP